MTMGYATEHIAYCIRLLINGATDSQIAESLHLLYFLIHFGVYLIFYFFFAKKMVQKHHYEIDAMASLWVTLDDAVYRFIDESCSKLLGIYGLAWHLWSGVLSVCDDQPAELYVELAFAKRDG